MAILDRVLGGNIFFDFWKQIQQYIFSEKRLMQLLTFKPIEIYKTITDIELDGVKIKLSIISTVENLMQRRINRTLDLLTINASDKRSPSLEYNFDILIKAQMVYEEVSKFFSNHFANRIYTIKEQRYFLRVDALKFNGADSKAFVSIPFCLFVHWGPFKREICGEALLTGAIHFHHPSDTIRTWNLNYLLYTNSILLRFIDRLYHKALIAYLRDFLQYNFKEELFNAKVEAQLQLNAIQHQSSWLSGNIYSLDLERLSLGSNGVEAIFLAKGKLHIVR